MRDHEITETQEKLLSKIQISDIDFGHEEAEYDLRLVDFFISLPILPAILNGKRNIIIGPKGSGKSAIHSFLIRNNNHTTFDGKNYGEYFQNQFYLNITDDTINKIIKNSKESERLSSPENFNKKWIELFENLSKKKLIELIDKKDIKLENRDIKSLQILDIKLPYIYRLKNYFLAFIKGIINSVKISYDSEGKTSIEFEATEDDFKINKKDNHWENIKTINNILKNNGIKFIISIDNIDTFYAYEKEYEIPLVQGLFIANNKLKNTSQISPLIFIRTDIMMDSEIKQMDKISPRSLNISWTKEKIKNLIFSRFLSDDNFQNAIKKFRNNNLRNIKEDFFSVLFPSTNQNQSFNDWLNKLCDSNGNIQPRNVIYFLNQCSIYNRNKKQINSLIDLYSCNKALSSLSESLVKMLMNDYQIGKQLIDIIENNFMAKFNYEDMLEYFPSNEAPYVSNQLDTLSELGYLSKSVNTISFNESKTVSAKYLVAPVFKHHWKKD